MNYIVEVRGEMPVACKDWRAVEAYLLLLQLTDWHAYLFSVVRERE